MRYPIAILAALLLFLGFSGLARADAFNPATVPADAKWVIHLDFDALRKTKSWDRLSTRLLGNLKMAEGISRVESVTGLRFPDDVHDVTLYGRSVGEGAGVVAIHADFDQDRILAALQTNPEYNSASFGSYQILSWHDEDKDKTMYGSFHDKSNAIIAQSPDLVQGALDTVDKKSGSQKPDSTLAAGSAPSVLIYVAGSDVSTLKLGQAQSPIVQQVDSAWISLGESKANLTLKASITARSVESAKQMRNLLEGVRALAILNGGGDHAGPRAKNFADAVENLDCKLDGKVLNVEWSVPIELAGSLLDRASTTQENSVDNPK